MKIFIDTANLDQIKEINSWGIVDGVTTNPVSSLRKEWTSRQGSKRSQRSWTAPSPQRPCR